MKAQHREELTGRVPLSLSLFSNGNAIYIYIYTVHIENMIGNMRGMEYLVNSIFLP